MSPRRATPAIAISCTSRAMRLPRKALAGLIEFVAARERARLGEVDLAVVTGPEIARVNRRYLAHSGPTDVISFNLAGPGEPVSAQLVVCADVAVAEARRRGVPARAELFLYVIHGLLHTLGYDDGTPAAAEKMAARQERLLGGFIKTGNRQ